MKGLTRDASARRSAMISSRCPMAPMAPIPASWTPPPVPRSACLQAVRGTAPATASERARNTPTSPDLRDVLTKGREDFTACRSDVIFLCVIYPLAGLVLALSLARAIEDTAAQSGPGPPHRS